MGQPPADILDHAVECGAGHWDYHLYDEKFNETRSGELEVVGCSINEVRDMVLFENKLERRSMTPTDHRMLMEKAAMREQEAQAEKRESVLGQLSALKTSAKGHPAPPRRGSGKRPACERLQTDPCGAGDHHPVG